MTVTHRNRRSKLSAETTENTFTHLFSSCQPETPMLDDGEEGGVRLWHLVKASEEAELPKHRRGSVRERGGERAKAIPEIYLTRLLSMKVKDTNRSRLAGSLL